MCIRDRTRDIRDEAIEKIEVLPLKYIDGHSYGEVCLLYTSNNQYKVNKCNTE